MEHDDQKKQQEKNKGGDLFDNLMFGPPRRPIGSEQSQPSEDKELDNNKIESSITSESEAKNEQPQLDFAQMMQQFDSLMGYVNKLGPSLKKMGPLFDLFKGFNSKK